jgi:predicted Rossmann fold nucleotide-binding protein DprA/Smf involved in DNA uptake
MKIAIVGSRHVPLSKLRVISDYVEGLTDDCHIVSGGAAGVDSIAELVARARGMPVTVFCVDRRGLPAYPEGKAEYRRRAFARNRRIVLEADKVVAFWDGASKGTENTIEQAKALGRSVEVVSIA